MCGLIHIWADGRVAISCLTLRWLRFIQFLCSLTSERSSDHRFCVGEMFSRYWGTSKVKRCQNRKAGSAQLTNLCYKSETRFAPMWRNLNLWSSLLIRNKSTCHPLGYIFDTDAVSSLEKLQVSVHISAVISRNVTCFIVSTLLAAVIGVTQVTGAFLTNPISLHPPATSAVRMVELVEEASRLKWKASYCVFLPSWCSHLLKVSWQSTRVHSRCYF